jgi:hypothetical protein
VECHCILCVIYNLLREVASDIIDLTNIELEQSCNVAVFLLPLKKDTPVRTGTSTHRGRFVVILGSVRARRVKKVMCETRRRRDEKTQPSPARSICVARGEQAAACGEKSSHSAGLIHTVGCPRQRVHYSSEVY